MRNQSRKLKGDQPAGSNRIHAIELFLVVIVVSKVASGRLPLIISSGLIFFLYIRRVKLLSNQIKEISKGEITYPSIITIIDSLMIMEQVSIIWGVYSFVKYFIENHLKMTFADSFILSFLSSHIIFLLLVFIQQILLSFFFTTCVGHGFFLFSVLPRFFAGARTFLVSFIWFQGIASFAELYPIFLQIVYLIFKGIFMVSWMIDFIKMLSSKNFPPEFGTKFESQGYTCPVCFEKVLFYITLPCSHHFCMICFCKWGSSHLTCPVCRAEFSSWIHLVDFNKFLSLSLFII